MVERDEGLTGEFGAVGTRSESLGTGIAASVDGVVSSMR